MVCVICSPDSCGDAMSPCFTRVVVLLIAAAELSHIAMDLAPCFVRWRMTMLRLSCLMAMVQLWRRLRLSSSASAGSAVACLT
jgi:hypothetical protein